MSTPLDELRTALTTIERESAHATPGEWWATRDLEWPDVFAGSGMSEDVRVVSEARLPADAALIVNAVSLYRGVVRDQLSEAVETGTWASALLDIARAINAQTEGQDA